MMKKLILLIVGIAVAAMAVQAQTQAEGLTFVGEETSYDVLKPSGWTDNDWIYRKTVIQAQRDKLIVTLTAVPELGLEYEKWEYVITSKSVNEKDTPEELVYSFHIVDTSMGFKGKCRISIKNKRWYINIFTYENSEYYGTRNAFTGTIVSD